MFLLNLIYVNQADREREIEDGIRRRLILQSANASPEPVNPPMRGNVAPRQASIRPRAATR